MSGQDQDSGDKSFEATPEKLRKARERGEVPRSSDLSVAAAYGGLLLAAAAFGPKSIERLGTTLQVLLDRPDLLAPRIFGGAAPDTAALMTATGAAIAPFFLLPAVAALLAIIAQRALVFAPTKLTPKMSRISLIANAKNKFGRSGLFEFFKSFCKLLLYSICLGLFLRSRLPEILGTPWGASRSAMAMLARLCLEFLFLVLLVAAAIGALDAVWQFQEHMRKNRMTRKEIMDETKDAEGDPHMKGKRRQRGQEIAMNQMLAAVPDADVVIVNPTHFAVALKWSREPGSAPVCVAKGVDEIAASIRKAAAEAAVPVHSDPPTARALHSTTEIGAEVPVELYEAVAVSIRFAENMRNRARRSV